MELILTSIWLSIPGLIHNPLWPDGTLVAVEAVRELPNQGNTGSTELSFHGRGLRQCEFQLTTGGGFTEDC